MLVLTYRGEEAVKEHKSIFEAALARDSDSAVKQLEDHIRRGIEHTLAVM